ncbi:hypothetical protein ACHHYP_09882 [Achlya hypogyna]|uniref:Transmembrane protein n=1 Tax=Achlya hypogyna TaxID=1202772 RepID=A0A1V9ZIM7_ACHHY|nr:hypothetical protein ACHHYP_09882 [Achlya hypogyna]
MQYHQRPDLSGGSEAVSLSATRKRVNTVPVELALPNQQALLGFPDVPPPTTTQDDSVANKAVFMTNSMRKHPDVREYQVLFILLSLVNIAFTCAFLIPANSFGHVWYNVVPFGQQGTAPDTLPQRIAVTVSASLSIIFGALAVCLKQRTMLLGFILYITVQDALLLLRPPVFLLTLRIPLDVALGGLAYGVLAAVSPRWFVTRNKT